METGALRLLAACRSGRSLKPKIYYQQTFKADFRMQIHSHTLLEIMYAAKNYFTVIFPDQAQREQAVKVRQGEYIIINSAVYHSLLTRNKEAQIVNIEYQVMEEEDFGTPLSPLYTQSESFRRFVEPDWDYAVIGDHEQILTLLKRIQSVLMSSEGEHGEDHTSALMLQSLTTQFFLESGRAYSLTRDTKSSYYVQQAMAYINEHFDEDIRIADIADFISINPTYLENLFKQHTKITLTNYINKQRIAKAVSYLSGTKLSVVEIGFIVGFNNRQHFTRVFQQLMHTSPGEYRRLINSAEYKNYEDDDRYVIDKYVIDKYADAEDPDAASK